MTDAWPFAGREALLARCGALLGSPRTHAIGLVGATGSGKSRLLVECCGRAHAAGFGVLRATAHRSSSSIPFGALAPLLPSGGEMLASGVPLLRQAADALIADAAGRPVLLAVDDAHLLDEASAVLLHQLAAARQVFVLVTVRQDEPAPDAVVGLWRDATGERVDVPPLDRAEVADVVGAALGGVVAPALVDALTASSEGNPLVLRELVRGSLAAGALVDERGLWRAEGPLIPSAPLQELHSGRLAALDGDRRRALELIAIGEPLGLHDAEALTGVDVASLEDDGFAVATASGKRLEIRVAQPSVADVLRAGVPTLRGRSVRRDVAARVLAVGARRRGDVLKAAVLLVDAGEPAPRPVLAAAAREAFFANDLRVAERLALAAESIEHEAETGHLLAATRYRLGAADASRPPVVDGSARERALQVMNQAAVQYWHLGLADDADATLAAAVIELDGTPWPAELIAFRANLAVNGGRPAEALQRLDEAADLDGRALVLASLVRSLALPHLGRALEALDAVHVGRTAHAGIDDRLEMFQSSLFDSTEASAVFELGRLQDAVDLALGAYHSAATAHDTAGQAFNALVLGRSLTGRGRAVSALRWLREANVLFDSVGHRGPARWCLAGAAFASVLRGDLAAADSLVERLDAAPAHPARMLGTDVARARAWSAVARGHADVARATLRRAADECHDTSQRSLEIVLLHDLARLGAAGDVVGRVDELAAGVEGAWLPALRRDVEAIARRDAEALVASAEELAGLGADLLAAESLMRAATAHATAGRQREAAACRRRSAQLLAECEGARTPGVADGDGPVPLTDREREIALLAATGLTSKTISERLYLSVRTVDNNLARVYGKLGIPDRTGIAAALGLV